MGMSLLKKIIIVGTTLFSTTRIFANPVVDHITASNVTIHSSPNQVIVNQTSEKTIINWKSFNIGPNESTHFQQPVGGGTVMCQGLVQNNSAVTVTNYNNITTLVADGVLYNNFISLPIGKTTTVVYTNPSAKIGEIGDPLYFDGFGVVGFPTTPTDITPIGANIDELVAEIETNSTLNPPYKILLNKHAHSLKYSIQQKHCTAHV